VYLDGGGVPLVGPHEELRDPSGYTFKSFYFEPRGVEAKEEFSGFITTDN